MIDGAKEATTFTTIDRLKIALIGAPKSGKSRLAATAPKPVFVWDFDDRKESIAGSKEVFVKTLVDSNPLNAQAAATFLTDIGKFEYMKSKGDKIPETFVIDSMTNLSRAVMNYVMTQSSVSGVKDIKVGPATFKIARGYDPYGAEEQVLTNALIRLFALGSVIAIFHERPEEAADSTQENPKFTGKFSVHPPRYINYLPTFNEQWRMIPTGGKSYKIQTQPDYQFTGASCLELDQFETILDIEQLIKKHTERMAKKV